MSPLLLLQDEHTSSRGHPQHAPKVATTDSVTGAAPALSMAAARALAASPTAAHASTPAPKESSAVTTAPDAAQQQGSASTPALLAATAAAASKPDQALLGLGEKKKLPNMPAPIILQQMIASESAVADSQGGAEEAGMGSSGTIQADQAALGGAPAEMGAQVTTDEVMVEATEAADQLLLSYPATLVATLPCTVPTWFAHSQRTTATAVVATQPAPTQVAVQASVAPTRAPPPSAHTVALTKCLLPATSTGRVLSHAGGFPPQDRPQTRLVSRLSQLGEAVSEVMPDQAITGSPSAAFRGGEQQSGRKHASGPGQTQVAARAGLPHADPGELRAKAAQYSSAANCQAAWPDETGAGPAGISPSRQAAERGKRAAERSPGLHDVSKAPHKRARSDSPTAKQEWLQGDSRGAQRLGPSDADVQV